MLNGSDNKQHWDNVYQTKSDASVSWYEETPELSLALIRAAATSKQAAIVDIGGGASRLAGCLLEEGYKNLTVLDISASALNVAKSRLNEDARKVSWVATDVTQWSPPQRYDVWHDRAAFHFLTGPADQEAYARTLKGALEPEGAAIIGTFALNGPERCSGLPIQRHDAASISRVLGPDFTLYDSRMHVHVTPAGAKQQFQFSAFRRTA